MICGACGKTVPDESAFCLSCGARLVPAGRVVPVNGGGAQVPTPVALPGGGATTPASRARPERPAPPTRGRAAAAGGSVKQAYALSFRPIPDERLRYRLARFICERAPVHTLGEVQVGLTRGDFLTFLALSSDEAETTRQGILALGADPAQLTLAPATTADLLRPPGSLAATAKGAKRGMQGKDWAAVGLAVLMLFLFGLVVIRLFSGRGF